MSPAGAPRADMALRCVVTGASGFIGRALCRRLRDIGSVRAIVRRPADGPWDDAAELDLGVDEVPAKVLDATDVVFHLASKTHDVRDVASEEEYETVNILGTASVLRAAREAGVKRVVFLSSVKAMGEGGRDPQDEASEPHPATPYGRTKYAAEKIVLEGGFVPEPVVLRLPLVYGPGVKGNLERMIEAIDGGRFPALPDVANRRSMIHIDDVVEAAILAARREEAAGRTFILTDGHPYSTREICDTIRHALGKPPWRRSIPLVALRAMAVCGDVAGTITRRRWPFDSVAYHKLLGSACYDGSAARETLGFVPRYTLEGAMPAMVEAFKRANRP